MSTIAVSYYNNVKQTQSNETIPMDILLEAIKSGKWQDDVLKIRTIREEDQRRLAKAKMANVTISGIFDKRVDSGCKVHSGIIAIDIDDLGVTVDATKNLLSQDPFVYAAFVSVSGLGLCVLIKIDGERHRDAFEAIADYLIKKYQITVDTSGINVSRTRYVSYDPFLYLNEGSLKWKKYLPKPKKRKITQTIFVQTEFDEVIRQMVQANVSCVEDYRDWRDIAFGLADQFGEAGRSYFHQLSSCSQKYEQSICDRQYDHAVKRGAIGGKKITIATIYWFAKQAGINIFSERTRRIAAATSTMKKSGLDAKTIAKNLEQFEGVKGPEAMDIINQAFAASNSFESGESLVENVRMWIRHNYELKWNLVTRRLEMNGKILDNFDTNTMYLNCKVVFDKLNENLFYTTLLSHNTPSFNPLKDWFENRKDLPRPNGVIEAFFSAFKTNGDDIIYFGKKWLVGVISSVYGQHSPLMLILAGEKQGTGKTEAFRRLLPTELKSYYAESKLDNGKDDDILMTQKLIIMDDEMGGKNKKESKKLKSTLSKETFSLREPYGKMNVDMKRLAVLCGTTNDIVILNDPTGNRRLLPMEIDYIDFAAYNAVDKEALFMEAWHLYHEGFEWQLTKEDILRLGGATEKFEEYSMEYELIQKYFDKPADGGYCVELTATEIKMVLETKSFLKCRTPNFISKELGRMGFNKAPRSRKYENGCVRWIVIEKMYGQKVQAEAVNDEQLPF